MQDAATGLSEASRRAYASDLADFDQWCRVHGLGTQHDSQLSGRYVFSYFLELARSGRARSTIRRKFTTLRRIASISPAKFAFDPTDFARFERRILDANDERAKVLIISDDAVIRAGLRGVLSEVGAVCWSDSVEGIDPSIIMLWDYVLVWISSSRGSDRYGAISGVAALGQQATTAIPIVAVHGVDVAPAARLRLAEAGFRYLVPHSWLSGNLTKLSDLLSAADIPIRFHLETPLALRESLGLHLDGELAELVDMAAALPAYVWQNQPTSSETKLARANVNMLRAIALHSSGVPAPDFSKYATSMRRPPELPEWPRVRELLRQGLGYRDTTAI